MLVFTAENDAFPLRKDHFEQPTFDLRIKSAISIKPYENRLISTGIKIKIPQGEVGLVIGKNATNREGLFVFPTLVFPSVDTYIAIQVMNVSDEIVFMKKGHPLAQFLMLKLGDLVFDDVKEVSACVYQDILKQTT